MRTMLLTATAMLATALPLSTPAFAQAEDAVIVVYGNDKCPAQFTCERRPEGERYRIPKELRTPILITPENQSWAAKANDTLNAGGQSGAGSCSAVGPGGWTGCWAQQMRDAKRQRQVQAEEGRAQP